MSTIPVASILQLLPLFTNEKDNAPFQEIFKTIQNDDKRKLEIILIIVNMMDDKGMVNGKKLIQEISKSKVDIFNNDNDEETDL